MKRAMIVRRNASVGVCLPMSTRSTHSNPAFESRPVLFDDFVRRFLKIGFIELAIRLRVGFTVIISQT